MTSSTKNQVPQESSVENPAPFDLERVRSEFPCLGQHIHAKPLVYLDNAATTQKPLCVIDAISEYYQQDNANIHRGVHTLSERATLNYEQSRDRIQRFINAKSRQEIIFVRGATEGINLIAASLGARLGEGDEIVITEMEHHANIVPWQLIAEKTGASLRFIPLSDDGELLLDVYQKLLSDKTRIVALTHISNAIGSINPLLSMTKQAHEVGAVVMVDGAQGIVHAKVDVQELDCDFYVFSGHKLFAPTGIGVLYGKQALLDSMNPYQGGGDMIKEVSMTHTTYNDLPYKFEAGTPNIAGVIGLGAAIAYLEQFDMEALFAYEQSLLDYALEQASDIEGLRLIGTAKNKASIFSFVLGDIHPHDIGTILDSEGVAIRAGHHCAMPTIKHFDVAATARASFAFYNTYREVDCLFEAIALCKKMLWR